jgi:autophagy-related protein 9
MSSNILSRFLPPTGSPSVYETIRQHDAGSEYSDLEERAGLVTGDQQEQFSDRELEDALADAQDSEIINPSTALLDQARSGKAPEERASPSGTRRRKLSRPRWMPQESSLGYELDDHDEDVPQSLLVEGHHEDLRSRLPPPPQSHDRSGRPRAPSPEPSPQPTRARWNERGAAHQPPPSEGGHPIRRWFTGQHPGLANTDPKKKAMWRWANVEDLDNFLKDVYIYFLGNGIWSILLTRVLNLL